MPLTLGAVQAEKDIVHIYRRQDGSICVTPVPGDVTLDCLFNIADILATALFISYRDAGFPGAIGSAVAVCMNVVFITYCDLNKHR